MYFRPYVLSWVMSDQHAFCDHVSTHCLDLNLNGKRPGVASDGNFGSYLIRISGSHLSTAVALREKKFKRFVFNKYFTLILGVLKSKFSKKFNQLLGRKCDFKLFH